MVSDIEYIKIFITFYLVHGRWFYFLSNIDSRQNLLTAISQLLLNKIYLHQQFYSLKNVNDMF